VQVQFGLKRKKREIFTPRSAPLLQNSPRYRKITVLTSHCDTIVGHSYLWAIPAVWRVFKTAHHKVEDFRNGRKRQPDDAFLSLCDLRDPESHEDAFAVRRAVAYIGLIDALLIHASDRFPEELGMLPLWDSMDWMSLIFELEHQLGRKIPEPIEDWGLQPSFSVKDLVEAVVSRRPT
jgi:acyl carrier protein